MTDRLTTADPFNGVSKMAALLRGREWAGSALGDPDEWPTTLCAIVSLMLDSRFPMFVAWGSDLSMIYNDAYAEILGDKHPAAVGAKFEDVWSEIWSDISPLVERALLGEATWLENLPLRMNRKGYLEDTWFTFSYSPACDDRGDVVGMFCACTETTGRIKAEKDLRELNQSLELRVLERSGQLMKAEETLRQSQKLEAIGQLTGGVAHDFNNLLTVIRGSVDLLRRDNLTEEKRRTYIDAIGTTADRATNLTRQLLAFARRQALTPELIDTGVSLTELATMIGTLTGSRITLHTQVPDYPCYTMADRALLDTAIVNMAINARDAMEGAGTLTIATGPVSGIPGVRGHSPVAGDYIAVTVADTGSGIAEDDLIRIFEPFFTTKPVGQGTGLGLSQVFGFAKQSGGDIRVDSEVGRGTTFTLYLPRIYPNPNELLSDDALPERVDGDGICVLVVEDNEPVGAFATQALKELGYDSILAPNAEQALAELAKDCSRFHLVFSDVVMPGMSGLELGAEIRKLYPSVPVILTSGYSHVLAQNGTYGFELLHKPYSVEQLSRVLRKALHWKIQQSGDEGVARD